MSGIGAGPGGRPLRFLAVVAVAWVGMRIAMSWPLAQAGAPDPAGQPDAVPATIALFRARPQALPAMAVSTALRDDGKARPELKPAVLFRPADPLPARDPARVGLALLAMMRFGPSTAMPAAEIQSMTSPATPAGRLAPPPGNRRRWTGSGWLVARRGGMGEAGLGGPTLGASQAGGRIGYPVDPDGRLLAYGRVSGALGGPGKEAALGLDWRPTGLAVHLIGEQRLSLDGGKGGPTLGMIGGVGPSRLPNDFRLEGYGEAGIILRDGGVGFADGAVRIGRRIASAGPADIALGAGAWGAVQPGAARFDIGPAVTVDLPVRRRSFRLSLDWRQRVAGEAGPGSGPALTLGTDF